jgi:Fe-S cluster assembly protein SufD
MSSLSEQRHWFSNLADLSGPEHSGPEPDWLQDTRARARQAITELPVPNRKLEAWRYTSIEGLLQQDFSLDTLPARTWTQEELEPWLGPAQDVYRLVFVNGQCIPRLATGLELPTGVTLGSLRAALGTDPGLLATWVNHAATHEEHLFSALNTALIHDGLLLHVAADVHLDRPIEVVYLNLEQDRSLMVQPRSLVVLEPGASATLVERFAGADTAVYFHNQVSELVLQEGAHLRHYRLQEESAAAWHLASLYLSQGARSHYQGTSLSFGGRWARTEYQARLQHEGAHCDLNGLYTVGKGQLNDFHLDIRHSVPGCTSREQFKGILHGKGRAVFDGRILVEKQAQRTDARLSNDNLMLVRDAEVDTKPQLEIHADDVQCSHGTTVGQLDPQQVFYLRSRGIDTESARRMLCLGFAAEIIDAIDHPGLRERAMERLLGTIQDAPATLE